MDQDARIDPPVAVRPIRADDSERLSATHARLSPESRYRRFLATKPELTVADVRYLVDVDGIDHIALVATRQSPDGEQIVGVARCTSRVQTPAASPNEVAFASRSASASSEKRIAAATGPNTSSRASRISLETSPNNVGSTKKPRESSGAVGRPPPESSVAPSLRPISM